MSKVRHLAVTLAFLIAAGCGKGGGRDDAGTGNPCEGAGFELGSDTGHAAPLGSAAGETRAGRLEASAIPVPPGDPESLRVWAPGDFVLANDRIAVVVEDAGASDHFDPWGGKIVGLARVEGGAMVEPAELNEIMLGVSRFTVATTSVGILDPGGEGRSAIVRAVGRLQPIPFVDSFAANIFPDPYDDITVAVDYVLAPGAEHVDVVYRFANGREEELFVGTSLVFPLQFYSMPAYTEVDGFHVAMGIEDVPYAAYVDDDATSYAIEHVDGPVKMLISTSGANVWSAPPYTAAAACSFGEHPMVRIHVGGQGVDGLREAMARTRGVATRAISGTVVESDGTTPAPGVRVHASSGGTYLTRSAVTGEDGAFTLHVPADAAVTLRGFRRGDALSAEVPVAAGGTSATITMGAGANIVVNVTELGTGEPIPARIQIIPAAGAPAIPAAYGEPEPDTHTVVTANPDSARRVHVAYAETGTATLRVANGTHRVLVSRGYEYDLYDTDVVVNGADVTLDVALDRTVDTTGVMCGDFHVHTNRSPDSPDSVTMKLRSAAADGLEIPVRSDHEWIGDFEEEIARVGLSNQVFGVSSLELTSYIWGHFGVFPMSPDPSQTNAGAAKWYTTTADGYTNLEPNAVLGEIRTWSGTWGTPTIIVNHPRSVTFGVGIGFAYFTAMGYDPTTGDASGAGWDDEFGLVEVFNDSDFDANYAPTEPGTRAVDDWFSFLAQGKDVFAVGSSDSHGVDSSPVGYPRTCIRLGVDTPTALRAMGTAGPEMIRDAMLAGRHSISGGVYVDASIPGGPGGTIRSGDTLTGADAVELVDVVVRAAPWVDVDRLRVFVSGELTEEIALDGSSPGYDPASGVRFADQIQVSVAATGRTHVILVADGDERMHAVHPGRRPFGVTNPIFLTR